MFFGQFYEKWVSVRERNIKLLLETVTHIVTTETVTCIIKIEIVMCITGFPAVVKNIGQVAGGCTTPPPQGWALQNLMGGMGGGVESFQGKGKYLVIIANTKKISAI